MTKITLQVERHKLILKLRAVHGGSFLPASSSFPGLTLARSTFPLEELPLEDILSRSYRKEAAGQVTKLGYSLFNSALENLIHRDSKNLFDPMINEYNASMLLGDDSSSDNFIYLDSILEQIQVGLYKYKP